VAPPQQAVAQSPLSHRGLPAQPPDGQSASTALEATTLNNLHIGLAIGHLPTKGLGSVTPWPYLRTTPPTRSSQNIPSETAWKIEHGRSMTYAPEHGKVLCDRPHRRRRGCIEPHPPPPKAGEEDPKTHPPARSSTRSSSTSSKAAAPGGYYRGISPRVGNRLAWWFGRWRVDGTFERLNQRRFVRATEGEVGKEPATSCRHSRLPVGQEHRGRRRTGALRRQQEG
jgi:hypothetical protein